MLKNKEQTQDVVANMLTEPCDKNLLDSGYAYGYAYESRKNVKEQPYATLEYDLSDDTLYVNVSVSLYNLICDNLLYDPVMTAAMDAFIEEGDYGRWGVDMSQDFAEYIGASNISSDNTYNSENCCDTTFLFTAFEIGDRKYIAIATHNGCDVRSGYSSTKVFRAEYTDDIYSVVVPVPAYPACPDCHDVIEVSDATGHTTLKKGEFSLERNDEIPYFVDGKLYCPKCHKPYEV